MTTPTIHNSFETSVNAFLLGIGVGTLVAMVVKPREWLKGLDKVQIASEESFPASDAPGY